MTGTGYRRPLTVIRSAPTATETAVGRYYAVNSTEIKSIRYPRCILKSKVLHIQWPQLKRRISLEVRGPVQPLLNIQTIRARCTME